MKSNKFFTTGRFFLKVTRICQALDAVVGKLPKFSLSPDLMMEISSKSPTLFNYF